MIFKEESYLDKVTEIAKGSYFIETLTHAIADKSWEAFKSIEQRGGFIKGLENTINKLNQQQFELITDYKEGKRVLVGVNKFINSSDAPQAITSENTTNSGIQAILISQAII